MYPPNDPTTDAVSGQTVDPPTGAEGSSPFITIPLTEEQRVKWKGDFDRAERRRKVFEPAWEKNLKAYAPDPNDEKWGSEINPGVDFYEVEQKKNQLFFDTPVVILTPDDGVDPQTVQAIAQQQQKVNKKLGRKGLDAKRLMDKVAFDILCPAGIGCTKLGVEKVTKDVPVPHPVDPSLPNLGPDGQPMTAPVPLYTKIFWERFSPKQVLIPTNFHDTEFDKAPWLGHKFRMPRRTAIRSFGLAPDFDAKAKDAAQQVFQYPGVKEDQAEDADEVTGIEAFYKAALYDDEVWHPEWYRQIVFLDGVDDPVVHRDSPYQTFDPQAGDFTPDSLIGNPIHLITIRDLADSTYVPSDCTVTRPLVNELARFRTQLVEQRDASTPVRLADGSIITPEVLAKIVRSPVGAIIVVPSLTPGQDPIKSIAPPAYQRENFTSQDIIERDLAKVTANSANQYGVEQDTARSATEMSLVSRNSDVRLQGERNRFMAGFLAGVAKLDALIKRFESQPGAQPVSGYSYEIKPDSGMHVDAAADRKFALDRYNFLAKDPNCNRMYLLKETAPLLHLDPTQLIVQPPPPSAPPPKTSVIIKGEDMSPLAPQYPNVLQVLEQEGVKNLTPTPVTPQLVQNAATTVANRGHAAHPGTAPKADLVDKHTADQSGNFPNQGGFVQ